MSQTKARSHVDLLNGSPGKNLLLFALPMILGNLFQQFYNMADSMIVGNFVGEESLAAVGASYALTNVFIMIAIGGGNGASVITSQYLGAKNYNRMKTSISTALISFLVLSLFLGGFGFAYNGEILRRLQTPENVLDQAGCTWESISWVCPFCSCTTCLQPFSTPWEIPVRPCIC